MKKIFISFMLLLSPLNLLAYSEYIIPGGENIGVSITSDGLVVVGFYKVDGKYIGSETLKVGDTILEIEGKKVGSINDIASYINDNSKENSLSVKILRNNETIDTSLKIVMEDGVYKTGLYIKDKVTGIGTLSYIDPESSVYGSLGHQIIMGETNNDISIKDGNIYESVVSGVDRSVDGRVGSKNASITYSKKIGTIEKNSSVGIFGLYNNELPVKEALKVADFSDIKLGKAIIYTTLDGGNIETFEIEITGLDESAVKTNKSIIFKVTDEKLLEETGGIVQGMSGSPIIQDNKIIGAVTHVVVDDVDKGFGVFIRTMLEEGER